MIEKINILKKDIKNKKITILGAGISGQGAALLASSLGCQVFISDIRKPKKINENILIDNINFEFGNHTVKCLDADLIIISPGINIKKIKILDDKIINNIPIVSEIEFASWFTKYPIIAITGSNGKSTTVRIIKDIFSNEYENVFLGGNIGKSLSENIFYEKQKNGIHIVEVSSFQLENIYTFKPYISCILNISEDHMDRYHNINDYFLTKTNITKNHDNGTYIIYNKDDYLLNNFYKTYNNKKTFSLAQNDKKIKFENKKIYFNEYDLFIDQNEIDLMGDHNIYNLMASIITAKIFNINNDSIIRAINNFKPLSHRLEKLNEYSKIKFINDSKGTNIHSTKSAIGSIQENIILILGGSKDKIDKKEFINSINKKNILKIICYGDAGPEILDIFKKIKPIEYRHIFKEAVILAIKNAKKNDLVLLSPAFKSYDQFKNFEERGNEFKKIINNYYT